MPWYVLTGAPGAGKTAIIRHLEHEGFLVVEEAATDVIALEQARGHAEPWAHPDFTDQVAALQRRRERLAAADCGSATVFLDRSMVCMLALSRFLGHPVSPLLAAEIDRAVAERRYGDAVFFVRGQGFVTPTAARRISPADAAAFEIVHEQTYRELGFRLTDVPAGPLAERAGLVRRAAAALGWPARRCDNPGDGGSKPVTPACRAGSAGTGWRRRGDGSGTVAGSVAAGAQEFEAKVASFVRDNRLYGAAAGVVHGDELVWSGGFGFADPAAERAAGPDVLYRIASITKTFTGTAIMQLRDASLLDLDDPVVKWIPELSDSASPDGIGAVTIRRLLSHESGLVSEPPGTDFMASEPRYEGLAARNLDRVAEIFAAVPPNTQTKYCNLGYQLLGEIVHRVSGISYPQYVAGRILAPLKMSSTGFEPLPGELDGRRATGYAARAFSDELSIAPAMPPLWAEGGLWSTVEDLARWLSFQLAAHPDAADAATAAGAGPDVLASATRREMHKPRYLSDEEWSSAWGITWYSVRKDGVTWVQHSGGLPGFTSNACFDRASRVGAIVLLNGSADASGLAMSLAAAGRGLAAAAAPAVRRPAPTPPEVTALLGYYAPADMSFVVKVEWRDGKITLIDVSEPAEKIPLEVAAEPGTYVAAPGYRVSGEPVVFNRRPDGTVESVNLGGGSLVRLDPVRGRHQA